MDPWLRDRYAGVNRREAPLVWRRTSPAPSRRARRDADHLLDDLARELRRRRAIQRTILAALAVVAFAGAMFVLAHASA